MQSERRRKFGDVKGEVVESVFRLEMIIGDLLKRMEVFKVDLLGRLISLCLQK